MLKPGKIYCVDKTEGILTLENFNGFYGALLHGLEHCFYRVIRRYALREEKPTIISIAPEALLESFVSFLSTAKDYKDNQRLSEIVFAYKEKNFDLSGVYSIYEKDFLLILSSYRFFRSSKGKTTGPDPELTELLISAFVDFFPVHINEVAKGNRYSKDEVEVMKTDFANRTENERQFKDFFLEIFSAVPCFANPEHAALFSGAGRCPEMIWTWTACSEPKELLVEVKGQ